MAGCYGDVPASNYVLSGGTVGAEWVILSLSKPEALKGEKWGESFIKGFFFFFFFSQEEELEQRWTEPTPLQHTNILCPRFQPSRD